MKTQIYECLTKYESPSLAPCAKRRLIKESYYSPGGEISLNLCYRKPTSSLLYDTSSTELLESELTSREYFTYDSSGQLLTRKHLTLTGTVIESDSMVYNGNRLIANYVYHHKIFERFDMDTIVHKDTVIVKATTRHSKGDGMDSIWFNSAGEEYLLKAFAAGEFLYELRTVRPSREKHISSKYDSNGAIQSRTISVYNTQGNQVLLRTENGSGKLMNEMKWEYDAQFKLRSFTSVDNGIVRAHHFYE